MLLESTAPKAELDAAIEAVGRLFAAVATRMEVRDAAVLIKAHGAGLLQLRLTFNIATGHVLGEAVLPNNSAVTIFEKLGADTVRNMIFN